MYKLINNRPYFLPYDLCYIKGTKELVLITEVNCNRCQDEDEYQWSYAVEPITEGNDKCAWFKSDELIKIKNIFEIISKNSTNSFSSSDYKFNLNALRRK